MPVFNLTLPRAVKALLERYPAETLKPGDVLITNDPWLCAGHLFDIAVVTPVFREDRVVGLMGTVGHVSDIGGTRDSPARPRDLRGGLPDPADEALRGRTPNETLFRLFAENVRNPEQVLGDVHSFVAANAIGAERLLAFMARLRHARSARARHCGAGPLREGHARRHPAMPDGDLHGGDLEQSARRADALSAQADGDGRRDRARLRRRSAAAGAGRLELAR